MILLDFKISENPVIIGIRKNHNNGFAGSLMFPLNASVIYPPCVVVSPTRTTARHTIL